MGLKTLIDTYKGECKLEQLLKDIDVLLKTIGLKLDDLEQAEKKKARPIPTRYMTSSSSSTRRGPLSMNGVSTGNPSSSSRGFASPPIASYGPSHPFPCLSYPNHSSSNNSQQQQQHPAFYPTTNGSYKSFHSFPLEYGMETDTHQGENTEQDTNNVSSLNLNNPTTASSSTSTSTSVNNPQPSSSAISNPSQTTDMTQSEELSE